MDGQHPGREEFVEDGPGVPRQGWQRQATRPADEGFLEGVVRPRLLGTQQALLRSQSGPFASLPFSSFPSAPHARFDPQPFRVLLLRRLWLQLPSSSHSCRCGRPLDSSGHHRAACALAGVLSRRGFALESAARVCREAGGRVSSNVIIWQRLTGWTIKKIEVVVDGFPCSMAPSLLWTPPQCLHFVGMGLPTPVAPTSAAEPHRGKAAQGGHLP